MFYFVYRHSGEYSVVKLNADDKEGAFRESKEITSELYEGRPLYEDASILVVSEVIDDDLPLMDWYIELDRERLKQEREREEARDRLRYERVRLEYEALHKRFGNAD